MTFKDTVEDMADRINNFEPRHYDRFVEVITPKTVANILATMTPEAFAEISQWFPAVRSVAPRASSGHEATAPAPRRPDMVDHPAHYGGADNPYEAIKVIDAWKLGFALGNTVKYIARAAHKGSELEDLKKARWYLDHEIERLEKAVGYLCPFCKSSSHGKRANDEEVFCTCGATVKWSTKEEKP